jgi:hypothetical protein
MKSIKPITILVIILISHFKVAAQLSERANDSSLIRIGTRPQSGNFAFYIGTSYQEITDWVDSKIEVTGIPLLNFKYYFTDEVVFGLGLQTYKSTRFLSGSLTEDQTGIINDIRKESRFVFSPRAEYHFSESNILDVYVGGTVPIGWEKDVVDYSEQYNISGDYSSEIIEKSTTIYGFGVFAGLQAFIADLPMAIGFEAGIRGFGYGDLTYKHQEDYSINGVESSQTFYTSGNQSNVDYTEYKELNYSKFDLGSDLRITFNYFFSR